jgi:hypothetical protein
MAYFSNSTDGMKFDEQCNKCKYGEHPCPIAYVQMTYNYDAANNEVATKILNNLVDNNGKCQMLKTFSNDLKIDARQGKLF